MTTYKILRAQVIPLQGGDLLLPNTAVAEVVRFESLEPLETEIAWVYGMIDWRGLKLPLLSMESLLDMDSSPPSQNSRVVVFNGLNKKDGIPFFAIISDGNPHLIKMDEQAMDDELTASHESQYIHHTHPIKGKTVLIPDLLAITAKIKESQLV